MAHLVKNMPILFYISVGKVSEGKLVKSYEKRHIWSKYANANASTTTSYHYHHVQYIDGLVVKKESIFTPPCNRGGVIFSLKFVCVSVCVCMCVCLSVCMCVRISCEQISSRTDAPIGTRFSLKGCFLHWLEPYRIW